MRAIFAILERAAESDTTVLVTGETGTGKDRAAESLHRLSVRRDKPYLVVDCCAMPAHLVEAELFGYERGAFTGADRDHAGAFEVADGGTLFLDEVGEMPLELQPKLLRAIEKREVRRLGSNQYRKVDVRVIAATNRDLRAEVNAQRFRSDLYYRLAVIEVRLPSLRERVEDIPMLVEAILPELDIQDPELLQSLRTPEFMARLRVSSWPGNVRALRNALERMVALQDTHLLEPGGGSNLVATIAPDLSVPLLIGKRRIAEGYERAYLVAMLRACGNNVSEAARRAKVSRFLLHRIIREMRGISSE
jgi:DNA-binding NtrC family response regulator